MISFTAFSTEVKAGLVAKYDQTSLFSGLSGFSFNQYRSSNPDTVKSIITVYYNDLKGREDVQEYLIAECQSAIIEKAKESQ